ncbi:hypothetical protein C8Q70DRAFT_543175 [Cubamyces menziesii]|uniref:Uncharacterized protein n=1 Tax=Trametes cubensis TaxID=1111947 RepID=A0AAD7TN52_9APHY|nr:hypothetical protein C8Q70DRAFT_543175 [Cubamyces menziesii]KAJ8472497.1 hypothetical protein ONZ51_g8484 [Trametes cubensis]
MTSSRMEIADYRDFFDRLATGDYHALSKELNIVPSVTARSSVLPTPSLPPISQGGDLSLDSLDSHTFEPTVEGLDAAVALLRGSNPTTPSKPGRTPEEDEEAFQFTFRLMIHKLYSLHDFAKMVDDVVSTSQERFQPLSPELTSRRASFSFAYADCSPSDGESFMDISAGSLASPSETTMPSSPSLLSLDNISEPESFFREQDEDAKVVKKRCIGRKLSIVDPDEGAHTSDGPAWVYDSAVASVEPPTFFPSYAAFVAGLPPMSPAAESPLRRGQDGVFEEAIDPTSRKRRFSLLAARGI